MMRYIIGIDPGSKGAVAVLTWEGRVVEVFDIPQASGVPDCQEFLKRLSRYSNRAVAVLEKARPSKGARSMFLYGMFYGAILAVLAANRIGIYEVTAERWKRVMVPTNGKKVSDAERKRLAVLKAKAMHPEVAELLRTHHRAEALLIAEYYRHNGR